MACLMMLASCSEEDEGTALSYGTSPVTFSVYSARHAETRGETVSLDSIHHQGIGIFAFYQKAKSNGYAVDYNNHTGEPTFMYNQRVTAHDDGAGNYTWTYSPTKYWPNNKNDQLTFFAYAPYDPATAWEDLKMETNLKGTKISRHYEIEDDVEDQQDFLWADPILNQKKETAGSPLTFNFTHLCARLSVSAQINQESRSIYVTVDTVSIKGAFLSSGTVVYTPADGHREWQDLGGNGTEKTYYPYRATYVRDSLSHLVYSPFVIGTTEQYVSNKGFMFVIPGTQDITLTAVVSQRSSTTNFVKSYTITKKITDMQLEENKAYNFKLNVALTPITFSGEVSAAWSSSITTYTSEDNGHTWY